MSGSKPETLEELRDRVIADGIAEVERVYKHGDPKRVGAVEGFELCRSLDSREAFEKVLRARTRREFTMRDAYYTSSQAMEGDPNIGNYWRHRYATLQVEWVLNCLLVAGWARPGDMLSGRAARKVAEVTR